MQITRVNGYDDARFLKQVLKQHNAFLMDDHIACGFYIFDKIKARVICDVEEVILPVIEEFRYYAPWVCLFYDEKGNEIASFEPLEVECIPLKALIPSQFYVNQSKLDALKEVIDVDEIILPVIKVDDKYILSDGHTRAYLAMLNKAEYVHVVCETASEYVFDFAQAARQRGIEGICDLKVLDEMEYEKKWIGFCEEYFKNSR